MKTSFQTMSGGRAQRAISLPELMVNVCLFTIAVLALVTVNLFGLFQDEYVNSMLGASDATRVNFNQMLDEIRSAINIQIGSGNYTNFAPITNNAPEQGDTIQIMPSTNLNCYIYYYFVTNAYTNSSWLMRALVTNTTTSSNTVIATYLVSTNVMAMHLTNMTITQVGSLVTNLVTNAMVFSAVAYNGTNFAVMTNDPY